MLIFLTHLAGHFFPWTSKTLGIGELAGMPAPSTATSVRTDRSR